MLHAMCMLCALSMLCVLCTLRAGLRQLLRCAQVWVSLSQVMHIAAVTSIEELLLPSLTKLHVCTCCAKTPRFVYAGISLGVGEKCSMGYQGDIFKSIHLQSSHIYEGAPTKDIFPCQDYFH